MFNRTEYRKKLYVRTCLHFKHLLLTDLLRCDGLHKLPSQGTKNSPRKKRKWKEKLRTPTRKHERQTKMRKCKCDTECSTNKCTFLLNHKLLQCLFKIYFYFLSLLLHVSVPLGPSSGSTRSSLTKVTHLKFKIVNWIT